MELLDYELQATILMDEALVNYTHNLNRISAGRANPQLLINVKVDYYGTLTPLNEIAAISVPEARQLLIKPFDASVIKGILSALHITHPNLNPVNEGQQIRISFPEVTTERRRELVKSLSTYTEQARINVRNARQEVNKAIKSDEALSEDDERRYLEVIQKLVDKYNHQIEDLTSHKEQELMKV